MPYFNTIDADSIRRYADLGVDRVITVLPGFDREGFLRAAETRLRSWTPPRDTDRSRHTIEAPMPGTVVSIAVAEGDAVRAGCAGSLEALKMEHVVIAGVAGVVRSVAAVVGATVFPGDPLAVVEEGADDGAHAVDHAHEDVESIRADLAEVLRRQSLTRDESRPAAVERRRKTGQRTARENIWELVIRIGRGVARGTRAASPPSVHELLEQTPPTLVGGSVA